MQQVLIPCISAIKIHNVRDRDVVLISFKQLDRIASCDFPFFENGTVKPGATTLQEPLHHVRTVEANTKFKAGHARLGHHELCRADAKAITNMNCFFKQPRSCEVFAEDSPGEVHTRKLPAPERVMLRWIGVNSLIGSSMHGQIRLLIPFYS